MRNEAYLVGIGIDTSEVVDARAHIQGLNNELEERLERLGSLREIDKAIISSLDLDLTLDVVLRQVRQRLGVDAASVLLYKAESQTLRFAAGNGFRSPSALWDTNLRLGEGTAGRAARSRGRIHINGAAEFEEQFVRLAQIPGENFRNYLAVPLVAKGQLKGVLEIFHRSLLQPDEDWLAFLDMLALQTAIALDNAGLFENLDRSNAELLLAYDTTIEGWARALDLRDHETEGHSRRVTELTVRLAEQAGASERDLVHVRRGALLHDIGKMGVPDSILLKPGKLEPHEWEEMQRHTTYALELLSPIAFLRPALDIPYCHHERWDGTGYPRGLKGEQIPIAARAFSVVDVYDALTSHRPYRPAWTEQEAVQYLRDNAGTQFDPRMVRVFLRMLEKDSAGAAKPDVQKA
jgi:putative nucleotidyltransferase with HDIG domain